MLSDDDKRALRDFCRAHRKHALPDQVALDAAITVEHEGTRHEAEAYCAEYLDHLTDSEDAACTG